MTKCKWFRKLVGGTWYRYNMTGQLPTCYGYWWTKTLLTPHRYYECTKMEMHKEW